MFPANPDQDQQRLDARARLDAVFQAAYQELHRLAAMVRRDDANYTQSTTALVGDAWLKLAATPVVADLDPMHFKRIAARAMRQVLVETARRRTAEKRGGDVVPITLGEHMVATTGRAEELLALDETLNELATHSPRQAQIVELRFFAGFEVTEVADALEISEATVHREWRAARAWLAARLQGG